MKGRALFDLITVAVVMLLIGITIGMFTTSYPSPSEAESSAAAAQQVQPAYERLPEESTMHVWHDDERCVTCYILMKETASTDWEMSCLPDYHLCPVE